MSLLRKMYTPICYGEYPSSSEQQATNDCVTCEYKINCTTISPPPSTTITTKYKGDFPPRITDINKHSKLFLVITIVWTVTIGGLLYVLVTS